MANITNTPTESIPNYALPKHGYSRASQLLPFLPFGSTTLWCWSKDGRFPKPIKLSDAVTAWSNADVHAWFEEKKQSSIDASN